MDATSSKGIAKHSGNFVTLVLYLALTCACVLTSELAIFADQTIGTSLHSRCLPEKAEIA